MAHHPPESCSCCCVYCYEYFSMGVTVRQPVHHKTQHRCSTEEVSFVVKPYVAQYLWLVTVFVIFVWLCFFSFSVCASAVNTLFFYVCWSCVYQCFFSWVTIKYLCASLYVDGQTKKKKKLLRFYSPFPPPTLLPASPPPNPRPCPPPQPPAAPGGYKQKPSTLHCHVHTFFRLLHFLHQQTFHIPLIVFSMHQKTKTKNIHRKYLSHTAVTSTTTTLLLFILPAKEALLHYGMLTYDIYLMRRQNFNRDNLFMTFFLLTILRSRIFFLCTCGILV